MEFQVLKPKIHSWVFSSIKYVPFLPITLQIDSSLQYRLASDFAAMLHTMTTNLSFSHVHSLRFNIFFIPLSLCACLWITGTGLSQPVTATGGTGSSQLRTAVLSHLGAGSSSVLWSGSRSSLQSWWNSPLELPLSSSVKCFPHTPLCNWWLQHVHDEVVHLVEHHKVNG